MAGRAEPTGAEQALGHVQTRRVLLGTNRRALAGRLYANHGEGDDSGNTVGNTTVETAFSSSYTVPANSLRVGDVIRLYCAGIFSTSASPTLQVKIKFGATVLLDTGAVSQGTGISSAGWAITATILVNAVGASGFVEAQAQGDTQGSGSSRVGATMKNTAPVAIDDTADRALTMTITWSPANVSNTINLRQMLVEILRK